jgi:nucleotide-binding universal stress UspA family protein
MPMKSLLAVLDHQASNRHLLETTCDCGCEWWSRLEVVLPCPQLWNPDVISVADETARERIQEIEDHACLLEDAIEKKAKAEFEECCRRFEIPIVSEDEGAKPFARWYAIGGFDRGCRIIDHARMADLVFVRRPDADTSEGYESLIGLILRGSGRPVILVPPSGHTGERKNIAIAWNESVEGIHAVSAAAEFIAAANLVDVLTVETEGSTGIATDRFLAYLASHDIVARKHVFPKLGNRSLGQSILDKCDELATDLLVIGANTHNRWRELTFGGVTRHLMGNAELPVLMAQ